jgi:HTH-type transcriptional regulator, transcriptional repressor of NAD biosynthesis genes
VAYDPVNLDPVSLVVGKFAPFHKGHQEVIEAALNYTPNVAVLVYSNPDFPDMPSERRANWIREIYRDHPGLHVFVPENPPHNNADDFTQREFVKQWLQTYPHDLPSGSKIEAVFGSDDYIPGFAEHLGSRAHVVDSTRSQFAISGTQLRQLLNTLKQTVKPVGHHYHWKPELREELLQWVHPVVFKDLLHWLEPVKRVVFMGAESTGKSTLAERMAKELKTEFVAEYGRLHYEQKGGVLDLEDYVIIAKKHRGLEDEAMINAKDFLFTDTNAITTLFFSYYYNQGGLKELHYLANSCKDRYHYVFVCADDIPFEQDGWRDNELWRARMQGMVLHDLECRKISYTVLTGSLEQRVAQVKQVLGGKNLSTILSTKHLGPKSILH